MAVIEIVIALCGASIFVVGMVPWHALKQDARNFTRAAKIRCVGYVIIGIAVILAITFR